MASHKAPYWGQHCLLFILYVNDMCNVSSVVKSILFADDTNLFLVGDDLKEVCGRVVKGVGHLDHVRSYGVREVVSSIPDRGNIVG